ncbi:MAG: T9SS type A sorting domain-containing protein [Bacteroidetes bacterium]|nr:T9SS type A sorting domain-containing protein [Bacteroidota bacterium]
MHTEGNIVRMEGIESYREQISEIAFQCPYQGGQGVFRARFFLSLFNDSIEYDDASVCLAQGILKVIHSVKNIAPSLLIKPNPASNETEVLLTGIASEKYLLKIISQDGRIVNEMILKHSLTGNKINTSTLVPGVYYVEVITDSKSVCRGKLVIMR